MALKDARRCNAIAKGTGKRCKNPAIVGKEKCRIHGGKSLSGVASPLFNVGRWSKYIPKGIADSYDQYRNDPNLLSLDDDVALLRAMTSKHLEAMQSGDTHPAWRKAYAALHKLKKAIATGKPDLLIEARDELEAVIAPNYRATMAEDKVTDYIDQVGRIADKERRLMIDRQQMLTIEQALGLLTFIILSVRDSVTKHCDQPTARIILSDTQSAYDSRVQGLLPE